MKQCRCKTCGKDIDLRSKSNVEYQIIWHGYKIKEFLCYAKCPHCGQHQILRFKEYPLGIKWKFIKEYYLDLR